MMEKKAFIVNPKHQYRVSQCREHECSVNNNKNGNYYMYPRLSHSWMNASFKANGKKKSIDCKPKALISCIPMRRK